MEIASASTTAAARAPKSALSTGSADFETFLTLLTTQMRNQDPLKPLESTEFVAQLANFSAVEQQVKTNDALERIETALTRDLASGVSDWIGKSVRVPADAEFSGSPLEILLPESGASDRAVLVVRNQIGTVVDRRDITPGSSSQLWDGTSATGGALLSGRYSFSVETYQGDQLRQTLPAEIHLNVEEVRLRSGQVFLGLADGQEVPISDVSGLRDHPGL